MICLFDNDLVKKLAICDVLGEALTVLQTTYGEVFVLPTARYVLLAPIKKPELAKVRLGEALFDRLSAFFENVQTLTVKPSAEEQRIFDDIVGIDPGEAVLFSASAQFSDFRLATGDKNSLRAVTSSATCQSICTRLSGKVVCFEQIILGIMDVIGFDQAKAKIVPGSNCDTALRVVFGSGLEATEENVRVGLAAYVADLRKQTGSLLFE